MRTIAFVGDRTPTRGCFPVSLKPEKPWAWPTVNVDEDVHAFAEFYASTSNQKRWWQPTGLRSAKQVPTVLYVPFGLAEFMLITPRTPWELFSEATRMIQSADNELEEGADELV